MTEQTRAPAPTDLDAVRTVLARLGVRPEQLLANPPAGGPIPTFDDYVERVSRAVSRGTRRLYATYWGRVVEVWGERRLDEPTALEIQQLAESVKARALRRRNSRGGRTAAEHLIAALRCLYRYAVADGLIAETDNPARKVAKPRRLASPRHALADDRLAEICRLTASTGDDPELDTLLVRLHVETACWRGGALGLRPCDLDAEQCLIQLREKGETALATCLADTHVPPPTAP